MEPVFSKMCPPPTPSSVRYSKTEWEKQRPEVQSLVKSHKLREVVQLLRNEKHFYITEKQLKDRLKAWGVGKNVKTAEMKAIIRKQTQRKAEGKGSMIKLRGEVVDQTKIARWQKRTKTFAPTAKLIQSTNSPGPLTPSELSCSTPVATPIMSTISISSPEQRSYHQDSALQLLPTSKPQGQQEVNPSSDSSDTAQLKALLLDDGQVLIDSYISDRDNEVYLLRLQEELEFTAQYHGLQSRYGANHPATLETAAHLAQTHLEQGRRRFAEFLCKQVATAHLTTLGPNSHKTLSAFAALAVVFRRQGRYRKAQAISRLLYSKALVEAERIALSTHDDQQSLGTIFHTCILSLGLDKEEQDLVDKLIVFDEELQEEDIDDVHLLDAIKSFVYPEVLED